MLLARFALRLIPALIMGLIACETALAENADIWGRAGENWKPNDPLKDFSTAGYDMSNTPFPTGAGWTVINVTSAPYGAKGDDKQDDAGAFQKAINACPVNGIVYVPNGTYYIGRKLAITKNHFILRGQSQAGAILYFPNSLRLLEQGNEKPPAHNKFSFGGALVSFESTHDVGCENLTFKMPDLKYPGHFKELGYNGLEFTHVTNGWGMNLTFYNCDSGAWIAKSAYVTLKHILFDSFAGRRLMGGGPGPQLYACGHHGIDINYNAHHNLVDDVNFQDERFFHELSLENNAFNNVYMRCRGLDLHLDHHQSQEVRADPNEIHDNLWTNIDVGAGNLIWENNFGRQFGSRAGSSPGEVYWNIRSQKPIPYPESGPWTSPQGSIHAGTHLLLNNIIVGMFSRDPSYRPAGVSKAWYETIDPKVLEPANLFLAQLAKRGITNTYPRPVARAGVDAIRTANPGAATAAVALNGAGSSDADGAIIQYAWSENGHVIATGVAPTIDLAIGTHAVTLTVRDDDGQLATDTVSISVRSGQTNTPPTVAQAASAAPNPLSGKTATLSVLGADDGGEAALIYAWTSIGTPPPGVTFSANNSHGAKTTVATFARAGTYVLQATIKDANALTTSSRVTVTVRQTLASFTVSPATATVTTGGTKAFAAVGVDQFGDPMDITPTWSVSGGGVMSAQGVFTAGQAAGGPYVVTARAAGMSDTATITITRPAPFSAAINFQPATAPTVPGWLVDSGELYGKRSNGLSYGWDSSLIYWARDRNDPHSPNQIRDTLILMQREGSQGARWEIQVPNGAYEVRLIVGDPSLYGGVHRLTVEGLLAINFVPTPTVRWNEQTISVKVNDGRLTIAPGSGALNTKICAVEIHQMPASAN